ncbi:MAG: Signal transduction histidine kinase CheA [Pseudomonadota bacterium]|nr:Signal transduction histidine kinase CheA [Pseudomonadota bacterium]
MSMNTEDTVEYNSLRWVKKELDLILHEAQASLSAYVEDTSDVDRLRECIEHLHMVHGTLQMVELYGAAQLAEEMEYVATALLKGELEKIDDAYDVLMRAMLQLPDYLESLQAGNKDVPMVLLPLLNDLRTSRNASLLSENVLFFPDIESTAERAGETASAAVSGQLLPQARKLRPHYQVGLLGWLKNQKPAASLKRVLAVLCELEKSSAEASTRRLWSIGAALVEGLLNDAVDASVSVKMLLGQIDRNIKQVMDLGESAYARQVPAELLKNLLYYVARINKDSERVSHIKQTYHLADLLPGDSELEEARSGLGGLNVELLRTVSQGIREDLLEVKDALEIFVHSESRDAERLTGLPDLLSKIADTLSMIGLGAARESVLSQREKISRLQTASPEAVEDDVMSIASVLLSVEAQLNSVIASRSGASEKSGNKRFSDLAAMPESEYVEVLNAVIREALQAFSDARQAILGFLENPRDTELLKLVLKRLEEVSGAMFMLPIKRLEPQLQALTNYVSQVLMHAGQVPERQTQDDLADVVTSIEYYLEAIYEGRPDLELSFATGERAAQRLNDLSSGTLLTQGKPEAVTDFTIPSAAPISEITEESNVPEEIVLAEPEVETTPVPPARQAVKVPVVAEPKPRQNYVILGDDADEEILEIFIEEALEQLASLSEQYPIWKNDPSNMDAMTTIRRSFHTLKGSGRLIGAQLIGEFSWAFENMLNRILDKTRPANQEVFDALDEALGVLPQMIEQLRGNREPIANVYELIERADALSKWRPKQAEPETTGAVAKKPEVQVPATPVEPEPVIDATNPESGLIDTDLLSDAAMAAIDETLAASEAELLEIESDDNAIEELIDLDVADTGSSDEIAIDLMDDLQEPQDEADSGIETGDIDLGEAMRALDEAAAEFDSEEIDLGDVAEIVEADQEQTEHSGSGELGIHMDPVLFEIYKGESESHLNQIQDLLDAHYTAGKPLLVSQELIRALHTLFGSARTAEVDVIAGRVMCIQ